MLDHVSTDPMSPPLDKHQTSDRPAPDSTPAPARPARGPRSAPALPSIPVEFRLAEPAHKFVPGMRGTVFAIEFFLNPEHTAFLGTENVGVDFDAAGVRLTPNGGAVCHKLSPNQVRVTSIYERADETLVYALFSLTNGRAIFVDGSNPWLRPLDVTMKVMGKDRSLFLVTEKVKPLRGAVPVDQTLAQGIRRKVATLRNNTAFPDRLAKAERLVSELSVLMESLEGFPGIDAQVVTDERGRRPRIRLRRT